MSRYLIPLLFIALSVGAFFLYTEPLYNEGVAIKTDSARLEEAKSNLDSVLAIKDELLTKYNSLRAEDVARLEKLMPDNLDNIKLIIDIDRLSKKYGLVLNAVKFDVDQRAKTAATENIITGTVTSTSTATPIRDNQSAVQTAKAYDSFGLNFTVTGTFDSFNKLAADIERNLRIVDISAVAFDATDAKDTYKFEVKAKIYWLKSMAK